MSQRRISETRIPGTKTIYDFFLQNNPGTNAQPPKNIRVYTDKERSTSPNMN